MVKNFGGNKAKKQGSKHQTNDFRKTTRFSKHPDEIYASVIKEYGGGRALIKCIDGDERNLIIRNKFKGKSKQQNYIKPGVWILAGKREWECLKPSSKETCDLLEVYSSEDAAFLRTNVDACWELLGGNTIIEETVEEITIGQQDTPYDDVATVPEDDDDDDIDDI